MKNVHPELQCILDKLKIDTNQAGFLIFIRNFNALIPHLIKVDTQRKYFTEYCLQALSDLSSEFEGPIFHRRTIATNSHISRLIFNFDTNKIAGTVSALLALFIISQLNEELITGHHASPLVKTNQCRLRVLIEKVAKGIIKVERADNAADAFVDIEKWLNEIALSDISEESCKAALLFGNIFTAVEGNNNFSTVNKKNNENKPFTGNKAPHKRYPRLVKFNFGSKKKSHPRDDITETSCCVFIEKPDVEASAATIHEVCDYTKKEVLSEKEAKRFSRAKRAIENSYVQHHHRVLQEAEAYAFYTELLRRFDSADSDEQIKSIFAMMILLLVAVDDTWLNEIVIVDTLNHHEHLDKYKIVISTLGYVQFLQFDLPHSYHVTAKDYPYLKSHEYPLITLPLPLTLIPLIIKVKSLLDSPQFRFDKSVYEREFRKISATFNKRFSHDKMREFTFNLYYRESDNDEVIATFLNAISPYIPPSSCYYASIQLRQLVNIHTDSFTRVFGKLVPPLEIDNKVYIGSELCIDAEKIKVWLKTLVGPVKDALIGCRTIEDLVSAHNTYVLYVTTILLILTGHRPVNDVFDNRNHFFTESGFILIGDKAVGVNHTLRMVPLCDTAIKQVEIYLAHLERIAKRISRFDKKTAGKLKALIQPNKKQSLPFLSLLSIDKNNCIQMSGVSETLIEEYWSELKLPVNFYRHLMCTEIKNKSINREKINFFMGHYMSGQNPIGQDSPVKSKYLIQELSSVVEEIARELDITPLKGISDGHQNHAEQDMIFDIPPVFPKTKRLGIKERLSKTKLIREKAKNAVSEYLANIHPDFDSITHKKLTNTEINHIKSHVMSSPKKLRQLMFHFFNLAIKKRARSANRATESQFYTRLSSEKSALNDNFELNAQAYCLLYAEMSVLINTKFVFAEVHAKNRVEQLALVYLYCLLVDLPYDLSIKDFYELIISDVKQLHNAQYFELINKKKAFFRYFPSVHSLLLIKKLKVQFTSWSPSRKTITNGVTRVLTALNKKNQLLPATLRAYEKVARAGSIINQSPAFDKQRKKQAFHDLPPNIRTLENT
jgi:hypothetical protein